MKRILAVEDAAGCAEVLAVALSGYELEVVGSGEEALARLGERRYEVVITDVNLPGMDGVALAERLRGMAVIVVSGSVEEGLEERARAAGALAFLAKPYSPAELRRRVQELLDETR